MNGGERRKEKLDHENENLNKLAVFQVLNSYMCIRREENKKNYTRMNCVMFYRGWLMLMLCWMYEVKKKSEQSEKN